MHSLGLSIVRKNTTTTTRVFKRVYTKTAARRTDHPALEAYKKKMTDFRERRELLREEKNDLLYDKSQALLHRLALAKQENNQPITEEEREAMNTIRENYPSFFEEVEQSDPEVENTPEYNERKQVAQVMEYLGVEFRTNAAQVVELTNQWKNTRKAMVATINSMESASQASASQASSSIAPSSSVAPSSSAVPSSSTASSSSAVPSSSVAPSNTLPGSSSVATEPKKSTSDYIDSLPVEYNPFDDIGND